MVNGAPARAANHGGGHQAWVRGEQGTKGAPRAAPRAVRRRGAGARRPHAFKGPAAEPSACRPAAPPDVHPGWHRSGSGLGFSTPASDHRSPGSAEGVGLCRSPLLQMFSIPVPAPCRVQLPAPPRRPDPVPVAAPLRGRRRLLPLGAHRALRERGRLVPRAGFVSPPCNKPSCFPPPHRCRCRARVQPAPGRATPGSVPALAERPLSRSSAARSRLCPRVPADAQPRPPRVPADWETAGYRGRERWERPPGGAGRPRAGCCPAVLEGPGPGSRRQGTSGEGATSRGVRMEARKGCRERRGQVDAAMAGERNPGLCAVVRERNEGTGGGSRGEAVPGMGVAGPGGPSRGRCRVPGPRGSPAQPRCHSPPRGDAPASGRRWRCPGSAGWVPPRAGRGRGRAAGPDPPGRQRGWGRERWQREG